MKIRKLKVKKERMSNNDKQRRFNGLRALRLAGYDLMLTWLKLHAPEAQEISANIRRLCNLRRNWKEEDLKAAMSDLKTYRAQVLSQGVLGAKAALDDLTRLRQQVIKGAADGKAEQRKETEKLLSAYGLVQAVMQAYGLEPTQIAAVAYSLAVDIGTAMLRKSAPEVVPCKAVAVCMGLTGFDKTKPDWVKPVLEKMLEENFRDLHAMMTAEPCMF